jgi:hypothetical protein
MADTSSPAVQPRWTCPSCNDEMGERFRSFHERACAALSSIEHMQIDALIRDLRGSP